MPANWTLTRRFDSPGGTVAYEVLGGGPPLVLLHGTPFWSYVWRRLAPVLAEHYTVYAYDLVGYGGSEMRSGQDVSLGMQSKVMAAFLRGVVRGQAGVVAHDFGGATTLRTATLEGYAFREMVLINPVAVAPWGSPFVQHVRKYTAAFEGLPDYIHYGVLEAYLQDAAFKPLPRTVLGAYAGPWTGGSGQAAFYRQIAQMDQKYTDEAQPHYGKIACPVHLIWGEQDRWVPLARGHTLHGLIPHSTLTTIPAAGHLVQEDQPDALERAVLAALGVGA